MSLLQNSNAVTPVSGYNIDNSARFNNPGTGAGSNTSRLTKTFGTPTNNKVWTVSLWAKRCQLSSGGLSSKRFFGAKKPSLATAFYCGFEETNSLSFRYFDSTDTEYKIKGTPLFRDCAAWLHCVFQFNSAHVTSTERMKMWVNGVQITDFNSSNFPPQNNLAGWNENGFVSIMGGNVANSSTPTYEYGWDGLLAEVHFVDGQALTPASFAETDEDTNQWKAIEYTGTHGNNGFYFEFKNSANFGVDSSANASNWTATSMGAEDQMIDTPQNSTGGNFCTLNPLATGNNGSWNGELIEGNLSMSGSSGLAHSRSTFALDNVNGSYWEIRWGSATDNNAGISKLGNNNLTSSSKIGADPAYPETGYKGSTGVIDTNGSTEATYATSAQ